MSVRRFIFPHAVCEWSEDGARTSIEGFRPLFACPEDTPEYRVTAREVGYGDDTMALCREHELAHSFLAELLYDGPSPTLQWAAGGPRPAPGTVPSEESLVLEFQTWLNRRCRRRVF